MLPALLVVGVVSMTLFGQDGLLERDALKQRLYTTGARVAKLESGNEALRVEIRQLRREPVAVQRAAAEQLLSAPPGSTIYRFDGLP